MDEELLSFAARYFAEACEESGHVLSGTTNSPCRCGDLAMRLGREREARVAAETFDVSRTLFLASDNDDFPNSEWPAAALVRMLADEIEQPPWLDGDLAKRVIRLTAALARIGELGIPPDAFIRVGLSRRIRVRITAYVMAVYYGILDERMQKSELPRELQKWNDLAERSLVEAIGSSKSDAGLSLADIVPVVQRGLFSDRLKEWISRASIIDIILWRYNENRHEELVEEDINLRGGHEAVNWVVDRFSHTHYGNWYRTSLYWELRYASNPEATAVEAGLPVSLLAQRPSHSGLLVESIVSRASYALNHEHVVGDISHDELLSYIALLLQNGSLRQAIDVLRGVLQRYPSLTFARSMLGFCLIPVDPKGALDEIARCEREGEEPAQLLLVNRAAAQWRSGQKQAAQETLRSASDLDSVVTYILWRPRDFVRGSEDHSFRVASYSLRKWARQALVMMQL